RCIAERCTALQMECGRSGRPCRLLFLTCLLKNRRSGFACQEKPTGALIGVGSVPASGQNREDRAEKNKQSVDYPGHGPEHMNKHQIEITQHAFHPTPAPANAL